MPGLNRALPILVALLIAPACAAGTQQVAESDRPATGMQPTVENPQDVFFAHLASLCGRAFRGEALLASGAGFEGEMIMHVRRCEENEIQIPLHVGENRSRTWIITRTAQGLRLKHDHRVEDGTDDPVTQYGGDTADRGTATRQSFPADAFTAELLPEAATNVWTITLTPGERLHYHLTRHDEPRATFEFDLTDEVTPPPAPWGYEGS
ncbi:hypothetical protein BH23GEM6_BH23GEM6_20890 [soil metagenome]